MINLQESIGPGRYQTHDTCISSQTRFCSQTLNRLHYTAWSRGNWRLTGLKESSSYSNTFQACENRVRTGLKSILNRKDIPEMPLKIKTVLKSA